MQKRNLNFNAKIIFTLRFSQNAFLEQLIAQTQATFSFLKYLIVLRTH